MLTVNWSQPQRQPAAGLLLTFLHTLGQLLKQLWPLLLVLLVRGKAATTRWYEIAGGVFLLFSVVEATWRFLYFRFYIGAEKLIVKSGWLKKTTTVIPLANFHSVEITQGPVHQMLSLVKLSIDTAGSHKTEATIDALPKPMAEALRDRLLQSRNDMLLFSQHKAEKEKPLIQLNDKDLFKLSLSANHLKAFFIFFVFVSGLYDNFSHDETSFFQGLKFFFPGSNIYPFLFMASALLLITLLASSADVFLRFHEFSVFKRENGFYITSGLFQLKEKMVAMQKVQFISWQASWMRRMPGLWMLAYHLAGADEASLHTKVRVPVTRQGNLPLLISDYYPLPAVANKTVIRIHPSYIFRRFLLVGLPPALLFMLFLLQAWPIHTLPVLIIYPAAILLFAWLRQRKFRLWAMDDVLYLKRGTLGEERIILQCHKLQFVEVRQSIHQRKKDLATVVIHTAGGTINLPYIRLQAASQHVNFALFKTETSRKRWL